MRGDDQQLQTGMFSYVALEHRIPADHPLRGVRKLVDTVLAGMSKDFDGLYAKVGRPSIPPERLLRALLLQVFIRCAASGCWWSSSTTTCFSAGSWDWRSTMKCGTTPCSAPNRDRLLNQDLAQRFFARVKEQAAGLMSHEHFTVDGTLIEAWAGQKSFRRKDEEDGPKRAGDFHGDSRRNHTHASRTDPGARLYKKSAKQEAKLTFLGHTLWRTGTQADGRAERDAALLMLHQLTRGRSGRITTGADKALTRETSSAPCGSWRDAACGPTAERCDRRANEPAFGLRH
jgi:transposase